MLDPSLRSILIRMFIGLALLGAVVVVLAVAFREPLQVLGHELVDHLGYTGIGLGIMLSDMFTVPVPPDAYLLLGLTGGGRPEWIIVAGSIGSIVGGTGAYFIGRGLAERPWVARRVQAMQNETGQVGQATTVIVAVAALTPLPFSVACMLAGSVRMRLLLFWCVILLRIPRVAGYFFLIDLGWRSV